MFKRLLNVAFIFIGIGSGLIGDYPSITPSNSKLLPPAFAFSIWSIIYLTGIFLAYKLIRNQISVNQNPNSFILKNALSEENLKFVKRVPQ